MLTVGYGTILMLMISQGLGRFGQNPVVRLLSTIGQWSYNIYLWHFFLPLLIWPVYAPEQIWLSQHIGNAGLAFIMQASLYTVLSVFAGYLGTILIERPFLKLREKLLKREYVSIET